MRIIIVYTGLALLMSCSIGGDKCFCDKHGLVKIKNVVLEKEIVSFAKKYKINVKTTIVTVVISQDSVSESYFISTTETNPFMRKNKPFAYSNENSLWVAFFYAYSNPFNTKSIEKDFLCDLKDNGINLSNGYMLYNPHYLWLKLRKEKIVKKTEF